MAVRIPWDKYEAAILLDASLKVIQKKIKRNDAIRQVSYMLRQKAINKGIVIDSVYRNGNGISMQMNIMTALIENKPYGLHKASKIFLEIIDLYRTDYESYQYLLREAKQMVDTSSNLKEDFMRYVALKESQNAKGIFDAMTSIEKFAISTKAFSHSIYEDLTEDNISILKKKVLGHKFFIVRYKNILKYAELGLALLSSYISDNQKTYDEYSEIADASFTLNSNMENFSDLVTYDFNAPVSLSFTQPFSVSYFGETVLGISSWRQACTELLRLIYKKSNELFVHAVEELYTTSVTPLIGRKSDYDKFHTPGLIIDDYYIEMNKSSTNLISNLKKIIDVCNINYDDIRITYVKNGSHESIEKSRTSITRTMVSATADNGFITWMTQTAGRSPATARSYRSALNTCDDYAQKKGLYQESIVSSATFDSFWVKYNLLMNDNEFRKLSEVKHNYLVAALNKYREYMMSSSHDAQSSQTKAVDVDIHTVSPEISENCNSILKQDFEDGYRVGDYMDKMRFLSCYEDTYGFELEDGVDLDSLLKLIGQVRTDRIFCSSSENNTSLTSIYADLEETFDNDASAVFIECIFDRYKDRLVIEMSIYSADALRTVLINDKNFPMGYQIDRTSITRYGKSSDINTEIRYILQKSHVPMTYDEIKAKLWYIPLERIKVALRQIPESVRVDESTYFFAPNFYISSDEKIALIKSMHSSIYSKGYLVSKKLREIFRETCPSAALDSENYKDYGIREILKVILKDEFNFSSSVITEKGHTLDIGQVYQNYAAEHDRLTLSELKELQNELGLSVIYWDYVLKEMIRISPTELVSKALIHFDVTATDNALEQMYQNEYTSLKDINLFLSLPAVEVRWNGFVLESYLRDYSRKFRLIQLSVSQDDYFGVMLKSSSNLESYDDVAADMLAHNSTWKDEKTALKCLVDAKFQQRANNRNISNIVKAAKQKQINL